MSEANAEGAHEVPSASYSREATMRAIELKLVAERLIQLLSAQLQRALARQARRRAQIKLKKTIDIIARACYLIPITKTERRTE